MLSRYASLWFRRLLKIECFFFENDLQILDLKTQQLIVEPHCELFFQENMSGHLFSYHINTKLRESLKLTILSIHNLSL